MDTIIWTKMFGVLENEIVEVEARMVEGGYIVRQGCFRQFVEEGKLFLTRKEAEGRLGRLGPLRSKKGISE